jgi:hypothetical protein
VLTSFGPQTVIIPPRLLPPGDKTGHAGLTSALIILFVHGYLQKNGILHVQQQHVFGWRPQQRMILPRFGDLEVPYSALRHSVKDLTSLLILLDIVHIEFSQPASAVVGRAVLHLSYPRSALVDYTGIPLGSEPNSILTLVS